MTLTLIQKLLISVVSLTTFYLAFIRLLQYDLTRPISRSIFQVIPGFFMLGLGVAISYVMANPSLIFNTVLPLKSGFAKGVLSTTVFPLIAASVRAMSIIACITAFIDKFWFYWRNTRLLYLFRLASLIGMTIIAGNTLFKIIFASQPELKEGICQLDIVSWWLAASLGTVLFIVIIMATPQIFTKKSDQPQ